MLGSIDILYFLIAPQGGGGGWGGGNRGGGGGGGGRGESACMQLACWRIQLPSNALGH